MIITIGRQLGSGGREIGKRLSEALNISFYDKELIQLAAKESGMNQRFFEQADECTHKNVPIGIFGMRFPFIGDGISASDSLSNERLFKIQSDVIRNIADQNSCVFIGRCADYILRDRKDCFNIFITANNEDRIKRIIEYDNASVEKAQETMEHVDKKRATYYNYYSNKTWGVAASYHVCINSSVLGIDGTVDFLKEMVKKFMY